MLFLAGQFYISWSALSINTGACIQVVYSCTRSKGFRFLSPADWQIVEFHGRPGL